MKLLIAGGGTGGHLFPGIALAEEVVTRRPGNAAVFVGTARGIEAREVPKAGFPLELIDVSGLKGKGLAGILVGLLRLPLALFQSLALLGRHRPDVVVGVGGYASGPVLLAAWLRRIPTAIQEQNASPGMTNRVLGLFARAIFTAFPEAARHFPARKVHLLGNPIRRALMDNFLKPAARAGGPFSLLVFGGSQGAHALNERAVESMRHLPAPLAGSLRVVHQTGPKDFTAVRDAYAAVKVQADVREFIDDMSAAYQSADLVLCRAGATTLAELTVCKKAAILVPFPAATDDHQTKNAASMVAAGAAVVIPQGELTGERLAREIARLAEHPEERLAMEKAAGRLGRPEAAREIADVCAQLASRGSFEPAAIHRSGPEL
ncbi:MAG TPA: undecaprenyldiphospho-muramoylpentapeptide beta-N-acetylglucosaminyltransferase [Myxococcales bacterium]|nr:undecaprenyldiphospho-muramoylpentapeptide beta-N-acetylglucosaminyltransferase [Myxococcales bacterium]